MDALIDSIRSYGIANEGDIKSVISRLTRLPLSKNELLLKTDEICRALWFVQKGSLVHYRDEETGEQSILKLYLEGDWVLDHQSFTAQKPAENSIRACEDCEILQLTIHDLHTLIGESPSFFALGRILETAPLDPSLRDPKIAPESRYTRLLASKPEIIRRFPLKHVASYLGMAPETLSRVRSKLVSNGHS